MGIKDWFKKKPEKAEDISSQPVELPDLDRDALLEETISAFDSEEEILTTEEVKEATPEYDSGEVDVSALLNDEMDSNYELNTVDETDVEDLLEGATIIGDISQEVEFENTE